MKHCNPRHSLKRSFLISGALVLAVVGLAVTVALVLSVFNQRTSAAENSYPSTPEEWEQGGYADFASSMSKLYTKYDARLTQSGRVSVVKDAGVYVEGEDAVRTMEVTSTDDGLSMSAWGLLESLGYTCESEGEGLRAKNALRGDEVVLLPGYVEVNGKQVDVGVESGTQGLTIDVARFAEALGYEVLTSSDGSLTLQDPWETARVVTMGNSKVNDPAALEVVGGPNQMVVLQYGTVREAREAAERLSESGAASWVGPDRIAHLCDDNTNWEPAEALSWGNDYISSTEMQISLVAQYGSVSAIPEVMVAVIDTGIDANHELFAGRLVDGYDFFDDDADPDDTFSHGTHVSGIVVNNTADNVKVMALRAGQDNSTGLPESAIYSSIEYAISHGARVINMSYGADYGSANGWNSSLEQQAVRDAEQAGLVMVAAHGNDYSEISSFYPSSDEAVISVSSIDRNGELSVFSNFGSPIDLCAPGSMINSAVPGGSYEEKSGTSMATPFVSAASALVLSNDVSRSSSAVRHLLQDNAHDLGVVGWDNRFGYGCVDVSNLVTTHYAALIGSQGFNSFQAAYDAAQAGDTIVLLEDIEFTSTFELDKDVTIRSSRTQTMSLAEGAQLPMLSVTGNVTLGDSADVGRTLNVSTSDSYESSVLIMVNEDASLALEKSVSISTSINEGAVIQSEGELFVNGAAIGNTSNEFSIASSGKVALDGYVNIGNRIFLFDSGYIAVGDSISTDYAQIGIAVADPSEGRLVLSVQEDYTDIPPFYLLDTSWKLVQSEDGYVLTQASAYDARIGDVTFSSLPDAFTAAQDGDTVVVCRDVILSETLTITDDVNISSDGKNKIQASPNLNGSLITIANSADVTFVSDEGTLLELNGLGFNRTSSMVEVSSEGRLVLDNNVLIRCFYTSEDGVSPVRNVGELLIDGATISNNATQIGGGVYNEGTMELRSGAIVNNNAQNAGGGIFNSGSLVISGGHVDNNMTTDFSNENLVGSNLNAQGGGICNTGIFLMTDGSINGNLSDYGAGVYNSGSFDFSGGAISSNRASAQLTSYIGDGWFSTTANGTGGGVYSAGNFNMSGGLISQNYARDRGGAVCQSGEMILSGGEILDNIVEGSGYYSGPGGLTFFASCGIYSGGLLKLEGGVVKSSTELTNEVLITSLSSLEIANDFLLEGGMLWAASLDNPATESSNGLPIIVTSELTSDNPIKVFSVNYPSDTVLITYADGLVPDTGDFEVSDFGPNPYTFSGEDSLYIDDQNLVLTKSEVIAHDGWEKNGTCEQRIDDNGKLTVRPINGKYGALKNTYSNDEDIKEVYFEDGVWLSHVEWLFFMCNNLKTVVLNEANAGTNVCNMFYGCSSLTTLDLSRLDTSNVTTMNGMFENCSSLTSLDFSSFDTSNLNDMSWMFSNCSSLTELDISNFSSNVSGLCGTFNGCRNLTSVNLTGINTQNVTDMSSLFAGCWALASLDLSNFDTSNVKDMGYMFSGCSSLESLDLSSFCTSNVTSMHDMLAGCSSLTSVDLTSFDTFNVTDMGYTFAGCSSLPTINLSNFNTTNVSDMSNMFFGCSSLASLDLTSFNTSNVTNMSNMFYNCNSLTSLDLSSLETSNVTDMSGMFSYCYLLESLDLSPLDTSNVTNLRGMFESCSSLKSIDLSPLNTSNVTDMSWIFSHCSSLVSLDLSNIDTSSAIDMGYMFWSCEALRILKVGDSFVQPEGNGLWSAPEGDWVATSDGQTYSDYELAHRSVADTYIRPINLSNAIITVNNQEYSGQEITPDVTVTLNGDMLSASTDYDVTYYNNTEVGAATVTITGKGYYTGTATTSFAITAASISEATVVVANQAYTGSELKPAVTVTLGDKILVAGTDYTVTYTNNTEIGTAIVTIEGIGNYAGTTTTTFEIVPPEFGAQATTEPVNLGEIATFTCTVEGADAASCTYQWQYSTDGGTTWKNLGWVSAKTATLEAEATAYRAASQIYRCVVSASDGQCVETDSIAFDIIPVQVELQAEATTTPVTLGEIGRFACTVDGADGAALSYQWYYSADQGATWKPLNWTGAKTDTLNAEATAYRATNQQYRCVVTAADGRTATTNAITFDVTTELSELTATAATTPVALGETASFTCTVTGAEGAALSYQWFYSADQGTTWKKLGWASATTETLVAEATPHRVANQQYQCVVTASDGRTATTNVITFDIAAELPELTVSVATVPVALGEQTSFTCSVEGLEGATASYQWQYTADGGQTWKNLGWVGAKTDTLTAEATAHRVQNQLYRCVVMAPDGRTATTDAIGFEIANTLTATAETTPVTIGETATFTCTVEGANASDCTYQWQYTADGGQTWKKLGWASATTATLSTEATAYRAEKQQYRCVVTAADGRVATTDAIGFAIANTLTATAETSPVAIGEMASFTCAVEGAGDATLSYQWYYTTDNGDTWKKLGWESAKTDTLTAQATAYRVQSQQYCCVVMASDGRTAHTDAIGFEISGA